MPADAAARSPKVAIVLFNLGGPDSLRAVKPFLLNLFRDPAILRVPFFVRPLLARIIARLRVKPATENYRLLGGSSPLLELTAKQATALARALPELHVRTFVAMRYWHPFSLAAARAVRAWGPDQVVLLPLYPQFSTTTTGSSLAAWFEAAARSGVVAPTTTLCCFPADPDFIAATTGIIRRHHQQALAQLAPGGRLRVLFSAHGLPEPIVTGGDPYQWQVEQTVAAVLDRWGEADLDWTICYQSRATPQKWIGPSTDDEIRRAGRDGVAVLVVPIAFVSEHSETLVELDIEYRHLADSAGVPGYFRVPTQNLDPAFIDALANLVRHALLRPAGLCSAGGPRLCELRHSGCPFDPPAGPRIDKAQALPR